MFVLKLPVNTICSIFGRVLSIVEAILFHVQVCYRLARTMLTMLLRGTRTWIVMLIRLIGFTVMLTPGWFKLVRYWLFSPLILRNLVYGRGAKYRNVLDLYLPKPESPLIDDHAGVGGWQHANSKKQKTRGIRPAAGTKKSYFPTLLPQTESEKQMRGAPVVVFVSGGAWIIGYKLWSALVARGLAALGILVIVPDYRNFPQGDICDMMEDIALAVQWTVVNAARYGGDPQRIVLAGQSAGAHICLSMLVAEYLARKGFALVGEQALPSTLSSQQQNQQQQQQASDSISTPPSTSTTVESTPRMDTLLVAEMQQQRMPLTGALESALPPRTPPRKLVSLECTLPSSSNSGSSSVRNGDPGSHIRTHLDSHDTGCSKSSNGSGQSISISDDVVMEQSMHLLSYAYDEAPPRATPLTGTGVHEWCLSRSRASTLHSRATSLSMTDADRSFSKSCTGSNGISEITNNSVWSNKNNIQTQINPAALSAEAETGAAAETGADGREMQQQTNNVFHEAAERLKEEEVGEEEDRDDGGGEGFNAIDHVKMFVGVSGPYDLIKLRSHLHERGLDSSILHWICNGDVLAFSPTSQLRAFADTVGDRAASTDTTDATQAGGGVGAGGGTFGSECCLADFPPVALIHGSEDASIPTSICTDLVALLQQHGATAESKVYSGWSHTDAILEAPLSGCDRLFRDMHNLIHTHVNRNDDALYLINNNTTNSYKSDGGSSSCKQMAAIPTEQPIATVVSSATTALIQVAATTAAAAAPLQQPAVLLRTAEYDTSNSSRSDSNMRHTEDYSNNASFSGRLGRVFSMLERSLLRSDTVDEFFNHTEDSVHDGCMTGCRSKSSTHSTHSTPTTSGFQRRPPSIPPLETKSEGTAGAGKKRDGNKSMVPKVLVAIARKFNPF